jgi:hypothetical protein
MRAGQIAQGVEAGIHDPKRCAGIEVLERIPEGINLLERSTSHSIPVLLRICHICNCFILRSSRRRPPCLGHPDVRDRVDAADGILDLLYRLAEEVACLIDAICFRVPPVWISVRANKVTGFDHCLIRAVHPHSPGINVSDLNASIVSRDRGEHSSHVVDLLRQCAGRRIALVQVFAANTDRNPAVKAMCLHRRQQRLLLRPVMRIIVRPYSD